MNTHDLRQKINNSFEKEAKSGKLKKLLSDRLTITEIETTINFIKGYIQQTPDIMDQVFAAASKVGLLPLFQPVFNTVFTYWEEQYDVMPDNEGLVGLTDDAYLSLCLMQNIADSNPSGSNSRLIKLDLNAENKKMNVLFGPEIASKLDRMVMVVFSSIQFQNQLNNLLSNPLMNMGLQDFSIQQLGATNPQYFQYQQHMRDFDQISNMKHDMFMGRLGSMAADAGISFP